jgi:hypothetical protein
MSVSVVVCKNGLPYPAARKIRSLSVSTAGPLHPPREKAALKPGPSFCGCLIFRGGHVFRPGFAHPG